MSYSTSTNQAALVSSDSQLLMLKALRGEPIERPPVWMMRQAGRYMSEYREVKEKYGFLGICKNPEVALEVTMQPIKAFDPDAAILFADILLPVEGMGLELSFSPGPVIGNPVRNRSDVDALKVVQPEVGTPYVLEAVRLIKQSLTSEFGASNPKALLGFAGAPWTMACYVCDQGPYKHHLGTQVFAAEDPSAMHTLLEKLTDTISEYLLAQVASGADAVQLFDTWAGNLSAEDYARWALPYTRAIVERLQATACPVILYVNGSAHLLELMAESGADCLSLDWRTSLADANRRLGTNIALQGNLDPTLLFLPIDDLKARVRTMINECGRSTLYIANLGHGILQHTPPSHVAAFVDCIKEVCAEQ